MMVELFLKNAPIVTFNLFFLELEKCHRLKDMEENDDKYVLNLTICVFFENEKIPATYEKQLKSQ